MFPTKNARFKKKRGKPTTFGAGEEVYVQRQTKDGSTGWIRGTVVSIDTQNVRVQLNSNTTVDVANSEELVLGASFKAKQGIADMTNLDILHEGAIQENILVRYYSDHIYTYVGPTLISVNPYRVLPIYSLDMISEYKAGTMDEPHVFAVSERAYKEMRNGRNQSILISGESGAGKTEATKIVLKYITETAQSGESKHIRKQILDANPVLEAFGNAKTVRNNNSSRFGKYFQVQFNATDEIVGAVIIKYLLEKSRVVKQSKDERNYHIFYQLCAGCDETERSKFHIRSVEDYNYLKGSKCFDIDGVDDKEEFEIVKGAFATLGLTAEQQQHVLRVVSAILMLGNVEVAEDDNRVATIASEEELEIVAGLLGMDTGELQRGLTYRTMTVGRGHRVSIHKIPLDKTKVYDSRDALAKELYGCLFDWIVKKINASVDNPSKMKKTLGVLDIFGFEVFETNSFEQLCINYANEKLHNQFIHYYFKHEQEIYKEEEINVDFIDYKDNAECLKLIENKGGIGSWPGLLSLLQEECALKSASDSSFVAKANRELKGRDHFVHNKLNPKLFGIDHFAGQVMYNVTGFLEKNKDTLHTDLVQVVQGASDSFLHDIMQNSKSIQQSKQSGKLLFTVAYQFRDQVDALIKMLNGTQSNYIRCLKPNAVKSALDFNGGMILQQLQYSGVLESIKIRRAGYAIRLSCTDFINRFHVLVELEDKQSSAKVQAQKVIQNAKLDKLKFQVGKSLVFLKTTEEITILEKLVVKKIEKQLKFLQSRVRGFLVRKMYRKLKGATLTMQTAWRLFRAVKLRRAMMRGILTIQSHWRGAVTRKELAKANLLVKAPNASSGDQVKDAIRKAKNSQAAKEAEKKGKALDASDGGPGVAGAKTKKTSKANELLALARDVVGGDDESVKDKMIQVLSSSGKADVDSLNSLSATELIQRYIDKKGDVDELLHTIRKQSKGLGSILDKDIIMKGWLLKESRENSNRWKLRYCILLAGKLMCFVSSDCLELRSEFKLKDCEIKEERTLKPDETYAFAFTLKTHHFRINFAAPTRTNQLNWIKQIRKSRSKVTSTVLKKSADDEQPFYLVRLGWLWTLFESQEKVKVERGLRKYFCVLQDTEIHWYRDETCSSLKGKFTFDENCEIDFPAFQEEYQNMDVMKVECKGSRLLLGSPDGYAMKLWLEDAQAVVNLAKQKLIQKIYKSGGKLQEPLVRSGWVWKFYPQADDYPDDVDKSGWYRRFCILVADSLLHVFEDTECSEMSEAFSIMGAMVNLVGEALIRPEGDHEVQSAHKVKVVTKDSKVHELAFAGEENAYEWMNDINQISIAATKLQNLPSAIHEGWLALGRGKVAHLGLSKAPPSVIKLPSGRVLAIENWKARYCVITSGTLTIYTNPSMNELKGEISLLDCTVRVHGAPKDNKASMLKNFGYIFEIILTVQSKVVSATYESRIAWAVTPRGVHNMAWHMPATPTPAFADLFVFSPSLLLSLPPSLASFPSLSFRFLFLPAIHSCDESLSTSFLLGVCAYS